MSPVCAPAVPVTAWQPGDDSLRPLSELEYAARRRLDTAFDQAFAGYPEGVRIHPLVVRGEPGHVLVAAADRPDDLLVVGAGGHRRFGSVLHGSVARYCKMHAGCRVVVASPSQLLENLALAARSGSPLPFLAGDRGTAVGCVALRQHDDESCEMKRMYVDDAGRGRGVGRALGEAVIQRARDLGYSAMVLDTSVEQHEAIGLYRSLGFQPVEPYYDVPERMRGWLSFFRLAL